MSVSVERAEHEAFWRQIQLRSMRITQTLFQAAGGMVAAGPFTGLRLSYFHWASAASPKILGCYEQEIAHLMTHVRPSRPVVNLGCGEGYYAIGLARQGYTVIGIDTDAQALAACDKNARENGVTLHLEERAAPWMWDQPHGLAIVDVEGAEEEILDPAKLPTLIGWDIIVECHEYTHPGVLQRLVDRWGATHRGAAFTHTARDPYAMPLISGWGQMDQCIATTEGRPGPTPWLFLTPHDDPERVPRAL